MSVYRHLKTSNYDAPSGPVTLVYLLDQELVDGSDLRELEDELVSLVEKDQKFRLVLNFSAVTRLSSEGLNTLLRLNKLLEERNGKLRLCCINENIYEVFTITQLHKGHKGFEIRPTEGEALTNF